MESVEKVNTSKECRFCEKIKVAKFPRSYFAKMANRALYWKYSSSQNYYFTKEINEIIHSQRTPAFIHFEDFQTFSEEEEFLKRFYKSYEVEEKIEMLTEYYKYHGDVARIFLQKVQKVVNKFHDRKRRIEYKKITKLISEEEKLEAGYAPKFEISKKLFTRRLRN